MNNTLRPLYWRFRSLILNNKIIRRIYISKNAISNCDFIPCPVCDYKQSKIINFKIENRLVEKNLCLNCNHLFSNWLNDSIELTKSLFKYDKINHSSNGQKELIIKSIKFSSKTNGKFLDFGIGGNLSVYSNLKLKDNNEIFGCDIIQRNEKNYFKTYEDESMIGFFDAISSNAVVEHLYNTKEAWIYFNKLLKPLNEGGGIMLHAFPSQINFDYMHWTIKIKSHVCLFSIDSLKKIIDYAGFELIKIEFDKKIQHPVFYFKKIRDL